MFVTSVYAAAQNSSCAADLIGINLKRQSFIDQSLTDFDRSDSISHYNQLLRDRVLECAHTPASLSRPFTELSENGVGITASPDGKLRVYSWDSGTGGTMRYAINVFQYGDGSGFYSQPAIWDNEDDSFENTYFYDVLDQVTSEAKVYYLVKCLFIGSSAVSEHKIKIFSIDDGRLNENAALIKTATGIRNELSYSVDLANEANLKNGHNNREWVELLYDAKTKTISIPLITEAGRVTSKKIAYRFNGSYFVKL